MYRTSLLDPVVPDQPRMGDPYPIAQCYQAAKNERQKIEGMYDEAVRLAIPGRPGFSHDANAGSIYDGTAPTAVPEFASNIQAGIMPNFSRWASHIAGVLVTDDEDKAELREALGEVDGYIFDMINSSNAGSEVHESLMDLAVGTGCLRCDKGNGLHPLNVRAVPFRFLSFTAGSDGQPDTIFEDRELYPSEWDLDYPGIELPPDLEMAGTGSTSTGIKPPITAAPPKLKGVESWQRDWTEAAANRWICRIFFPNHNNHIGLTYAKQGVGCCPYIGPFRWSKGSGEIWGRGPLINQLPALRTVNFAMQALIDHSDFALAGVWNVEDDGVVNVDAVRLEPGALIPKAPGSKGLENIGVSKDFSIQEFMLNEQRKDIKNALYADELGDPNKSPKTATEVQQRMANLARRIGSPFGRIVLELILPFVNRVVYVLKEAGLIKLPTVDGKEISLIAASPLAQAQRFDDIDAVDRYLAMMRAHFGTEAVNLLVDAAETSVYLAERMPIPQRLLRSKKDQAELLGKLVEGISEGGGQTAGLGGEVIPLRNPAPATGAV